MGYPLPRKRSSAPTRALRDTISHMPYRIDVTNPPADVLDRLTTVEVLDLEESAGTVSALVADSTAPEDLARLLDSSDVRFSDATSRDDGSVWVLRLRPFSIRRWSFAPEDGPSNRDAIRLGDGQSFGTGLHPTTALCLEVMDGLLNREVFSGMLDVGTGSGILALAALRAGIPRVLALDVEFDALRQTRDAARLSGLESGLSLVQGGPSAIGGSWPLVFANILPAVLIDLAPAIAPRVARNGRLVLSGIPEAISGEVARAYVRCGLRHAWSESKAGWSAVVLSPSW